MIEFVVATMGIGFAIAQGGVIFFTAWLVWEYFALDNMFWKPLLVLLSYFAWIIVTGIGWSALGGGWGMMEGGLMIMALFASAALSSFVFLILWVIYPYIAKAQQDA